MGWVDAGCNQEGAARLSNQPVINPLIENGSHLQLVAFPAVAGERQKAEPAIPAFAREEPSRGFSCFREILQMSLHGSVTH